MRYSRRATACVVVSLICTPAPAFAAEESASHVTVAEAFAKHGRVSEVQAAEQSAKVFAAIRAELKAGRAVEVDGFGRFYLQQRRSRKASAGKLPRSRRFPRFRSAESLKEEVNSGK